MHSFLLIGQSNMAGRGLLEEAHSIDRERIFTLRNCRWQKMFRPIHSDRRTAGVCLAESFAERYAIDNDTEVGLICCADGGTSLSQWMPGMPLYENAVFQAKQAMRSSTLCGILWHQGEGDCSVEKVPFYLEGLIAMMTALRKELGCEELPLLIGGLGDFLKDFWRDGEGKECYLEINQLLKEAAERLPNAKFVSAKGLGANADNLHFNAAALYDFGLRYYDGFEGLKKVAERKGAAQDLERSAMELL